MSYYELPIAKYGYDAGTRLREVSLAEARAMECNRCGDCCNGLSEHVKKDPVSGLPLFVWGSEFPEDLYEERFGQRLLMPIATGDGGIQLAEEFDINDANGKPHASFVCSKLGYDDSVEDRNDAPLGCASCKIYEQHTNPDPNDISQIRPRNCGDFPVFGLEVADSIIAGHGFVPPTGALPRCTWYGIRVVGPFQNNSYWRERWDAQQRNEPVEDLSLSQKTINAISAKTQNRRVTIDGSTRKGSGRST